jgi:hypothetical protein
MKKQFFSRLLAALLVAAAAPAWGRTPNNWHCFDAIAGQWAFGDAPRACSINFMESPAATRSEFNPILFQDASAGDAERARYMGELYPAMRDFAAYYIKRRDPGADAAEVAGFQAALFALAHQESYWTHYRNGADGIVRSMRGDAGHGHGIMQIDDNAHFADVSEGKGVDFAENVVLGLSELYADWVRAGNQACVGSPTNYYTRARAAWAAYNGGPGSVCRFANASSPWAAHDREFQTKLDAKEWQKYVANPKAISRLDVKCLAEGHRPCALAPGQQARAQVAAEGLYQASEGRFCLLKSAALECVAAFADVACLESREGAPLPVLGSLSPRDEAAYPAAELDRPALCAGAVNGLFPVGSDIALKKPLAFEAAPGGRLIGQLAAGNAYRVLDFAVADGPETQARAYKISVNGIEGYVAGGTRADYAAWIDRAPAGQAAAESATGGLASPGDAIEVVSPGGINIRQGPDGAAIGRIPARAQAAVLAVAIAGARSSAYYKISYSGLTGFIYVGELRPSNTLGAWARPVPALAGKGARVGTLLPKIPYRGLRSCADEACAFSAAYALGAALDPACQNANCSAKGQRLEVLAEQGAWLEVRALPTGNTGWLRASDFAEIDP